MQLAEYLEHIKISQRKFALKVGLSPITMNRILLKKQVPNLETALKIEEETYGQVTCRDLLGYESPKVSKKKSKRQAH